MRYYSQSVMKLEVTKEEMECLKKFANFLNWYEDEVDDDVNTICDIITVMEDIDGSENDKELLLRKYHIDFEVTN